ncbi:YveK family protein [Williamsia phyllosphaerae]|uniref:Polysaccharide chain length determinant N-terminal domain-containing protein n=1 Tax=Williamsia phyllosphaerae TaxID=885042 RepID=A0ABQ1UPA7_9NOCA|nr:hypothetical protein [Williamsia phyllosphaerae]GGF22974.1 hypothetical protein GCM10007298_18630 [Williamsia phyllosphaerae]
MEFSNFLRRRLVVLIVGLILGAGAGLLYSAAAPTTYMSTTRVFIATGSASAVEAFQGAQAAQQSARTYAALAGGRGVLARAIERSGVSISVDRLQSELVVNLPPLTSVIDVSVNDSNAGDAVALARAVADELIDVVQALETPPGGGIGAIRLVAVDPDSTSASENSFLNTSVLIAGALVGLVFGGLVAWVLEIRRRRRLAKTRPESDGPTPPSAGDDGEPPVRGGSEGTPTWQDRDGPRNPVVPPGRDPVMNHGAQAVRNTPTHNTPMHNGTPQRVRRPSDDAVTQPNAASLEGFGLPPARTVASHRRPDSTDAGHREWSSS